MIDNKMLADLQENSRLIKEHGEINEKIIDKLLINDDEKIMVHSIAYFVSKNLEQFLVSSLIAEIAKHKEMFIKTKDKVFNVLNNFYEKLEMNKDN